MYILKLNSLQNRLEEDTKMYKQNFTELQQQNALLQEVLNKTMADLHQLSSLVWSMKLFGLQNEFSNQLSPVIVKLPSFTKKVTDKEEWYSSPFFAFEERYRMYLEVFAAGILSDKGKGTHVSV